VLAEEAARMAAVHRYELLDTPPDAAFDRITGLAARVLSVPMAIITVVDHDRIWFASHHGLEAEQVPRDPGLCASAILHDAPWIIEDARADPRARVNPLVAGDFALQFYAGVPLRTPDGYNLGTIAVLDRIPRRITVEEVATLQDLAAMVIHELELRLELREKVPVSVLQETVALELSDRSEGIGPASDSGIALVS
jgi:eukaryotic-like serine/threonine-protein kinase